MLVYIEIIHHLKYYFKSKKSKFILVIMILLNASVFYHLLLYKLSFNLYFIITFLIYMMLLLIAIVDYKTLYIYRRHFLIVMLLTVCIQIIKPINFSGILLGLTIPFLMMVTNIIKKGSFGIGDIEIFFLLSFITYESTILLFILSIYFACLTSLLLKFLKSSDKEIPFCPYIATSFIITFLYGDMIIESYLRFCF